MNSYKITSGGFAVAGGLGTALKVAGLGASIFGQIMNFNSQSAAAEAQAEMQRRAAEQRAQALALEQQAIRQREAEDKEQIARERFAAANESKRVKSQAEAAAAAAGVAGPSVDALMQDFDFRLGLFNEASLRQQQLVETSNEFALKGAGQQFQADITRINQPIGRPSAFGLALGVGSSLMNSKLLDKK